MRGAGAEPPPESSPPRGKARRSWLLALRWAVVASALIHPAAALAARWDWRADLLAHFQEPAMGASLLAFACLWARHRRIALAFVLLGAFQAARVFAYDGPAPRPRPASSAPRLRILVANVFVENRDFGPLIALIRKERPDVVGVVEFAEEWSDGLAPIRDDYPYRYEYPAGAQGLALFFREKPEEVDPPRVASPEGWPFLRATIDFAGRKRQLWLVHPSSPMRRLGRYSGFPELDALAETVADRGGSTIVVGDLNTTDGSPHFRDFLATTRLNDSRRGFGRQGSWPVGSPYRIAIDHGFLSEDLRATDRHLGPEIGSDHLPLILEIAPTPGP